MENTPQVEINQQEPFIDRLHKGITKQADRLDGLAGQEGANKLVKREAKRLADSLRIQATTMSLRINQACNDAADVSEAITRGEVHSTPTPEQVAEILLETKPVDTTREKIGAKALGRSSRKSMFDPDVVVGPPDNKTGWLNSTAKELALGVREELEKELGVIGPLSHEQSLFLDPKTDGERTVIERKQEAWIMVPGSDTVMAISDRHYNARFSFGPKTLAEAIKPRLEAATRAV